MTRLAIGIIVWNNADDAIECAKGLLEQTIIDSMKIVFIDNDSRADTVQEIEAYAASLGAKRAAFVETGYNGGTAGGFNAVVQWAEEHNVKYVGALNADAVADNYWCEALLRELDTHPDAGIATGIVLHRDGKTIDSTGDFYTTWGLPGPRGRDQSADKAPDEPGNVFAATGGGFVARTDIYQHIGGYDETMFMYYEDIDLGFRTQLAGYKVRYTPAAITYHKRGASSSTVPGLATYNTFKNLPMLFVKNVPLALWPSMYPRFVLMYTLILGNAILRGRGMPALKGWLMSWRYLPHMLKERRRIQAKRSISTKYIDSILLHDIPPDQTGLRKFRKIFTGKP